jgi:MFS transporter, YNFM family, putative membrane transport protein
LSIGARQRIAVIVAGFCTFLDLYATQPLLPLFAAEFGVSETAASLTVSATTLAIALVAPFTGLIADTLGRKRIIVGAMVLLILPTLALAFAGSLEQLILWRFVQGVLLPPVFAVTVAYIGDELPPGEVAAVSGYYVSGSGFGGFLGRFLAGIVAEFTDWRGAFLALAVVTLACAVTVALCLPRERRFVPAEGLAASLGMMGGHLRNPRLIGTFAVGAVVLFSFVAMFTYVNFYLAAPPFALTSGGLGAIFFVYLAAVAVTPFTGRWTQALGRRRMILIATALWAAGILVTLIPSIPAIVVGLAVMSGCGFLCQAAATGFLAGEAKRARSSAVGLYVTCYYVGGSLGAVLTGIAWSHAGWPGCVVLVLVMLGLMAAIVARTWR